MKFMIYETQALQIFSKEIKRNTFKNWRKGNNNNGKPGGVVKGRII